MFWANNPSCRGSSPRFCDYCHVKSGLQQRLTTSLFPHNALRQGCRVRRGVCAVCGAEAARASELATIEIHPSILPREDQREGPVSVDGWKTDAGKIQDVSTSCSSLIYQLITPKSLHVSFFSCSPSTSHTPETFSKSFSWLFFEARRLSGAARLPSRLCRSIPHPLCTAR